VAVNQSLVLRRKCLDRALLAQRCSLTDAIAVASQSLLKPLQGSDFSTEWKKRGCYQTSVFAVSSPERACTKPGADEGNWRDSNLQLFGDGDLTLWPALDSLMWEVAGNRSPPIFRQSNLLFRVDAYSYHVLQADVQSQSLVRTVRQFISCFRIFVLWRLLRWFSRDRQLFSDSTTRSQVQLRPEKAVG